MPPLAQRLRPALHPAAAIFFVLLGAFAYLAAGAAPGHYVWFAGLLLAGARVVWKTLRHMLAGHFATDIVATLAIVTAAILNEPLAGLIVVVMQTGGEALERFAEGRASQAVRSLEADAPRIAHRLMGTHSDDIPVDEIARGEMLLIRPGEMIPCDAIVQSGTSLVDTSRITGEPLPVTAIAGSRLLSGTLNRDGALIVRAAAPASASQYARIVELVRTAEASKAPLQRLADRYAVWFTPITMAVALIAWGVSGDAMRALAVLVVATPCPLILAAPVAIIGGINRAAGRQIILRTGGALERLERVSLAAFDKTGTLTVGQPSVAAITVRGSFGHQEVLELAGALEQHSGHAIARPVVAAALRHVDPLPHPAEVRESPGEGVSGIVNGRRVAIGSHAFASSTLASSERRTFPAAPSGLRAYVTVDGRFAGSITFDDRLRPSARPMLAELRGLGLRRTLLLSGDTAVNAEAVAHDVGIDEASGGLLPEDKVQFIRTLRARGEKVLMLGDGTNDAPALGAADVGVAMAAHGGGITAETADVVLLSDDLMRLPEGIHIARRTMRIARQSIRVGLGLSGLAMLFAAGGYIVPVVGALLQELIDVAVILNAVRASLAPRAAGEARPLVWRTARAEVS